MLLEMMSSSSARIVTLILVTAVFAEVWSHDHGPEARHATVANHLNSPEQSPGIDPVFAGDAASSLFAASVSQRIIPQSFRLPGYSFPIPGNISAGTYRVIDETGDVSTLVVTAVDLSGRTAGAIEDHLVIRRGSNRWHFIRIEADSVIQLASDHRTIISRAEVADAWRYVARAAWSRLKEPVEVVRRPIRHWLRMDVEIGAAERELN